MEKNLYEKKLYIEPKAVIFGAWGQKTTILVQLRAAYGNLDTKNLSRLKSRTPVPIFTNRTTFSPVTKDESKKNMKS